MKRRRFITGLMAGVLLNRRAPAILIGARGGEPGGPNQSLPYDRLCKYIRFHQNSNSSIGSWIDTGISSKSVRVVAKFRTVVNPYVSVVFGCYLRRHSDPGSNFPHCTVYNNSYYYSSDYTRENNTGNWDPNTVEIDYGNEGKFIFNSTVVGNCNTNTIGENICIGRRTGGRGSEVGYFSSSDFYYVKIYDDGLLVRDFIPCVKDDTGMFYDAVSNTLFENNGTSYPFGIGD